MVGSTLHQTNLEWLAKVCWRRKRTLMPGTESGIKRVLWTFRRSKATKLLATIECQKSTVQLMATVMTLAYAQRAETKCVTPLLSDAYKCGLRTL